MRDALTMWGMAITLPEGMTLDDLLQKVQDAVREQVSGPDEYPWAEATDDGTVIVRTDGGDLLRYSWTLSDDGDVVISGEGEKVKRVTSYETVEGSLSFSVTASLERDKYRVRVMGSGFGLNYELDDSGNRCQWFVPEDALQSCVDVFGGAKVHWDVNSDGAYDHADGWTPENELGYIADLALVNGSIEATLHLRSDVPDEIRQVIAAKRAGLSIEAHADRRPSVKDGKAVMELINFRHPPDRPATVALVTHPALEGEILRVAASRRDAMSAENTAAEVATTPAEPAGIEKANEVLASAQEQLSALKAEREKFAAEQKIAEAKKVVAASLAAEELPPETATFLQTTFDARIDAGQDVTAEEITASVDAWRKTQRGVMTRGGEAITIGTEPQDRVALRMENLFTRNAPKYVRAAFDAEEGDPLRKRLRDAGMPDRAEPSVLRLFRDVTGHDFTDLRDRARSNAVKASITTSTWGDAWENVINRAMVFSYRENPNYQDWRNVARVVPVQNFVKQERIVKGGYANLSTVAEGANYAAATSPGDEGHGYTPVKKGNTEDVTWEAMLRDDVGALTDLPVKLGLAASRTLYETVFDLLTILGQPTMDYDATACFDASHGNLGTTALASASLITRIKAMMVQTDLTTGKRLGVTPANLCVPIDLADTAFDLLKSLTTFPGGSTSDYEWIRRFNMRLNVVRHWTVATDWFLTADPAEFPVIEVGFVGGMEEPELYVQDNASFGSMFDADKVTYKIKHAYGATILRHEGVDGNNVP